MKIIEYFTVVFLFLLFTLNSFSRGVQEYVTSSYHCGDIRLVWEDFVADIYVSEAENVAVLHCANYFADDILRVTGKTPALKHNTEGLSKHAVIVGTVKQSEVIQDLVTAGKIDISRVENKWETFLIQVVSNPLPEKLPGTLMH